MPKLGRLQRALNLFQKLPRFVCVRKITLLDRLLWLSWRFDKSPELCFTRADENSVDSRFVSPVTRSTSRRSSVGI